MSADLHADLTAAVTALMELAQAATPGPWYSRYGGERGQVYASGPGRIVALLPDEESDAKPAPNSRHIAANDPATVIRHCQRDLEVLQRHAACTTTHTPAELALAWDLHRLDFHHTDPYCHRCLQPQPCPEVLSMARAHGVEASHG